MAVMQKLRVRLVIQPTVSHYRSPLIKSLLQCDQAHLSLFGRYTNTDERHEANQIASAQEDLLEKVDKLETVSFGSLRWEKNVVASVWRREFDAYVLEGRAYTVSTWAALILGRIRRVPVLLWGHGWKRPERGVKLAFRRAFYSLAAGLLFYGDWARQYASAVGIPVEKIAVVGNSIYSETDILSPGSRGEIDLGTTDKFTVIVSARLTPRHRVEILADAIEKMPPGERTTNVIVIGDGSERSGLERHFHDKGIAASFLGAVYGADRLRDIYGLADVAVSPRASGLNVVQALGFGVPILVPDNDPTSGPESELVTHGETGFRFGLDDVDDLAIQLRHLRDHSELASRMGVTGKRRVLATHTAESHANAIVTGVIRRFNALSGPRSTLSTAGHINEQ
jgi:glycosyltransferase involved in cell wall biosynthesis